MFDSSAVIIILTLVLLLVLFSKSKELKKPKEDKLEKAKQALIRQVYRWHVASVQDANPIAKMLHSNYSAGYVGALRAIASESELASIGLDINKLEKEIIKQQDMAMGLFVKSCPSAVPLSPAYQEYLLNYVFKLSS